MFMRWILSATKTQRQKTEEYGRMITTHSAEGGRVTNKSATWISEKGEARRGDEGRENMNEYMRIETYTLSSY